MNYQLYRDAKDKAIHIHKRITSDEDPGAMDDGITVDSVDLSPEELAALMGRIKDVYEKN